jgi:hypothetical protein
MTMMYAVWNKMNKDQQELIIRQAEHYLAHLNEL